MEYKHKKCGTKVKEDENPTYAHWRFFCPKCDEFCSIIYVDEE